MYKALLVDQPHICRILRELVDWEALGFTTVETAEDIPRALDQAMSLEPQVALIGMTVGDRMGYELAGRFHDMGLKTVCCLLTPHFDIHDARRAMRAGCRDFLRWPVDPLQLKEFLEWVVTIELRDPVRNHREVESDPVLRVAPEQLSKITLKVLQAVRKDYWHSLSLTAIADQHRMSGKYMGRVFLKDTGMKFSEYLMACRMIEARKLITGTREKVSVIAGMVGYGQLNNFYIHFRSYFGVSPSALRSFGGTENA